MADRENPLGHFGEAAVTARVKWGANAPKQSGTTASVSAGDAGLFRIIEEVEYV